MKKMLALLSALYIGVNAFAGVSGYPIYYEKTISKGDDGYMEYTVENDSPERARVKVIFEPNSDKEKFDIDIYPKVVFLEPYSKAQVKVLVKEKEKLEKPEYSFNLSFAPIIVPTVPTTEVGEGNIGIQGTVGINFVHEVIGYRDSGENPKELVKVANVRESQGRLKLEIDNRMKRSVKLVAKLTDSRNNYKVLELPRVSGEKKSNIDMKIEKLKYPVEKIEISELGNYETIFETKM